ncbi:MAG: hypothetical protein V1740_01205 [Candidatus Woesearchaeota archaeon]
MEEKRISKKFVGLSVFQSKSFLIVFFSAIFVFVLASAVVFGADVVSRGGDLFVDGSVGIGTVAPNYLLEIAGFGKSLNVSDVLFVNGSGGKVGVGISSPIELLHLKGVLGGNTVLQFSNDVSGDTVADGFAMGIGSDDNYYVFGRESASDLYLGANNSIKMAIKPNGKVGIGTASPMKHLHIANPGSGEAGMRLSTYSDSVDFNMYIAAGSGQAYFDRSTASSTFTFRNNVSGTAKNLLYLGYDGKVGIGTLYPQQMLHINTLAGGTSGIRITNFNGGADGNIYIPSNGQWYFDREINDSGYNTYFRMRTSGTPVNILTLLGTGRVGIGTATPSVALDVIGSVRADNYTEYSPVYIGNALSKLSTITYEGGSENGDWAEVDHLTLPEGILVIIKEKWYRNKVTNEELSESELYSTVYDLFDISTVEFNGETITTYIHKETQVGYDSIESWIQTIYNEFEKQTQGRNLGRQAQFNLKAIKELYDENQLLKSELCTKDTYSWC